MSGDASDQGLRYQADERIPFALCVGLGLQLAALVVAFPILIPTIVMRAAGADEAYLFWAVSASVAVCGAATALQAVRYGRIGAGQTLVMGSSAAFIWLCVDAIQKGGPALLATLVVVSAVFQFVLSARIALFRRILSGSVSATLVMLLPVTVMPVFFGMLDDVPEGTPAGVAPLTAGVTVLVIVCAALRGSGALRLWAPGIGVVAGAAVGALFGLYDVDRVAGASWIGLPGVAWPGLDLGFGADFWSLIPAFLLVTLVVSLRSISSGVAVQSVAWRRARAVDFRAVQGGVNVDGLCNLLCGLAGTVPNNAYSLSASLTELTGVAARSVGIAAGAVFVILAFFPKALAVVLAIPGPAVAGYLVVLMAILFAVGIKILVQEGVDYRNGLIVGVAFWAGVGFQNGLIFPELVTEFAGGLFANGMTSGGLLAILMTLFLEATETRRRRMEAELDPSALPKIVEFLRGFASRAGWDTDMADRLDAVGEEALMSLLRPEEEEPRPGRRLRLTAYRGDGGAVLEFAVAPRGENVQDRLALLGEPDDRTAIEQEVSLRLLRHLSSSVRHRQYHDIDVVTVHVKTPAPAGKR